MPVRLGVDTLCWRLRLEHGELTVLDVLDEASEVGAEAVQVNLHHLRQRSEAELDELSSRADELGLALLASGDFLGAGRHGDDPQVGVERIRTWLARAVAIGSPILRVASGFYRAELAGRPDLIEVERRYVTEVLRRAAPEASAVDVKLLLENHSDFTPAEYRSIIEEVDADGIGVFLDLINPIAALADPLPVVEELAPLSAAGHVKDYVFESIQTDDAYHRRGFSILYRYPGEGVADLPALLAALRGGLAGRDFFLSVEGLDNRAGVDDQHVRLARSLAHLRGLLA